MKSYNEFILESNYHIDKENLLGKKMYHGTTSAVWDNENKSYLFLTGDFEHAKYHADDKTKSYVKQFDKSYNSIVFEIEIDENILNLKWVEDDDKMVYNQLFNPED